MSQMNRTVELSFDEDVYVRMTDIAGLDKLTAAIGYLSQWNMTYHKVRIIGGVYDEKVELIATYWKYDHNDPQPIAYQIGAVWHDDHFGFHS